MIRLVFAQLDRLAGWYMDRRMGVGARRAQAEHGIELRRAELLGNEWRVDLSAPNLIFLLSEAAGLLDQAGAENYLELNMLPRPDHATRPIRVTIQWMHGESPAEQNARLRAELAELRAGLEAA